MARAAVGIGVAAALIGLALPLAAAGPTEVRFARAYFGRAVAPATVSGHLYRPDGPGPFPALVLLHGLGGIRSYQLRWAEWLRDQGYVTLVVDSLAPRGIASGSGAARGLVYERVWDAFAALAYLRAQSFVAGQRVGVVGWSQGGAVGFQTNGEPLAPHAPDGAGFRAVVAFYPGCQHYAAGTVRPILFLLGRADDWTPADRCVEVAEDLSRAGHTVEWVVYPGATHAFDLGRGEAGAPVVVDDGHVLRHDPAATADAERRLLDFMARHLRPR